jgi:Secretion system C-terminal sorting domain
MPATPPITVNTTSVNISPTQTEVTATISTGFSISHYQWNPNNGIGSTISITPLQAYSVTITDGQGCTGVGSGTANKVAQVNTNTIAVDNDKSKLEQIKLEQNSTVENDVLIVPNPASELAKLNFIEPIFAKIEVSVFDARGRTIEQKTFDNSNAIEINLANYVNGVYLIKIKTEQGEKFAKRLVVQHF